MALEDRDPHTGYLTTGHEWNGIKELNTPVPRAVYVFLIGAMLFALGYWLLMPAWPLGATYTKGLLGSDERAVVSEALRQAERERAAWMSQVETRDYAEVAADPKLMQSVRQTARALFGDNCAACHGRTAQGSPGFPTLTTSAWLWGGSPERIAETIRVGINVDHPDSRSSQMLAFGRDGLLTKADIKNVVAYVRSLSHAADKGSAAEIAAGRAVFAANCAACHGENGKGDAETGAPDLTDSVWIYGGDAAAVYKTVWGGRRGRMPAWEGRLPAVERKILALYLVDLRQPDRRKRAP